MPCYKPIHVFFIYRYQKSIVLYPCNMPMATTTLNTAPPPGLIAGCTYSIGHFPLGLLQDKCSI